MYLQSLYPPVPPTPDQNYHHALFSNPRQGDIPDYTLHIDGLTGRRRSRKEFDERMRDGATALAASLDEGGLALNGQSGDVVGIFSTNCLVSFFGSKLLDFRAESVNYYLIGLHCVRALAAHDRDTVRAHICILH